MYQNYANGFNYTAAGAVGSMRLGSGLWESTEFNSRLQPTQIALGSGPEAANKLKLDYTYGTTDNNGNVQSQTITVPTVGLNTGFAAVQSYSYDSLNRLKDATEDVTPTGGSASQSWKQAFTYDRYGNRNFDEANTTTLLKSCGTSPNFTVCAADRKIVNPSINTSNNRLSSSDNYTFDSSGNTTADANGQTYTYDGENKMVEASNGSGSIGQYTYDGDGKRVKKLVPSTGELTVFVYDAAGKQVAEYSTIVANSTDAKVNYLTSDHLGSPRINTDEAGNIISRHDYHPFGEEIDGTGGRTTGLNYGDDSVRKQFTGYERDDETGLDFAQARMYSNGLGRFISPDLLINSGRPVSPKSWNRYSYALDNPIRIIDPSGLLAKDPQTHVRRIYIFVLFSPSDQTKSAEDGKIILKGSPDFENLKKNVPKGTEVIIKTQTNLKEFQAALKDDDAAGVIFIGHGSSESDGTPYKADGVVAGSDIDKDSYYEDTKVEVKAAIVALFGCDSKDAAPLFEGARSIIAMDSGRDGLTSTTGLTQAGFAAAKSIIEGKSPDDVTKQANLALKSTDGAMTKIVDGKRIEYSASNYSNGDRVVKVK